MDAFKFIYVSSVLLAYVSGHDENGCPPLVKDHSMLVFKNTVHRPLKETGETVVGGKIQILCDDNYMMFGGPAEAECMWGRNGYAVWSKTGECVPKSCAPVVISNGGVLNLTHEIRDGYVSHKGAATWMCQSDTYIISNNKLITSQKSICTFGKWKPTGRFGDCVSVCPVLSLNSSVTAEYSKQVGNVVPDFGTAKVTCNNGPGKILRCQSGVWNGSVSCQQQGRAKVCPLLNITKAFVVYYNRTGDFVTDPGSATVICSPNYALLDGSGNVKITTCNNGVWKENPVCVPVCPIMVPHREIVSYSNQLGENYVLEPSTANVTCIKNHALHDGSSNFKTISCKSGTWNDMVYCVSVCPRLSETFAIVTYSSFLGNFVFDPATATVSCINGSTTSDGSGKSTNLSCRHGKWDRDISCVKVCPTINIKNSYIYYSSRVGNFISDPGTATVICNRDYVLDDGTGNSKLIKCKDGVWDQIPLCVPHEASRPETEENLQKLQQNVVDSVIKKFKLAETLETVKSGNNNNTDDHKLLTVVKERYQEERNAPTIVKLPDGAPRLPKLPEVTNSPKLVKLPDAAPRLPKLPEVTNSPELVKFSDKPRLVNVLQATNEVKQQETTVGVIDKQSTTTQKLQTLSCEPTLVPPANSLSGVIYSSNNLDALQLATVNCEKNYWAQIGPSKVQTQISRCTENGWSVETFVDCQPACSKFFVRKSTNQVQYTLELDDFNVDIYGTATLTCDHVMIGRFQCASDGVWVNTCTAPSCWTYRSDSISINLFELSDILADGADHCSNKCAELASEDEVQSHFVQYGKSGTACRITVDPLV